MRSFVDGRTKAPDMQDTHPLLLPDVLPFTRILTYYCSLKNNLLLLSR